MTKADKIYREMLLCDARKSRYPRLTSALIRYFWWIADDRIFAPFIVVIGSTILILFATLIAMVAHSVVESFFALGY